MERKWQLHTSHSEQCPSLYVAKFQNAPGQSTAIRSQKYTKLPYTWELSRSIQLTDEIKILSHYTIGELNDLWELQNRVNSLIAAAARTQLVMILSP